MVDKIENIGLKILNDLIREYADLLAQKERKEGELKNINKRKETIQQQLVDIMITENNTQLRLEGVGLVYISIFTSPKIINKEDFFTWLEDNNEAYIIKPAVHSSTLRSWYKQMCEKCEKEDRDLKEELKGLIEVFEKPQINLRRERIIQQ